MISERDSDVAIYKKTPVGGISTQTKKPRSHKWSYKSLQSHHMLDLILSIPTHTLSMPNIQAASYLNARPKRLISRSTHLRRLLLAARPLLHLVTLLSTKGRASNTLICIGSLLDYHLLVRALSAAAADADEPEEARANGEGDTDPEGR